MSGSTPYRCPTPCDEDCEINGWGCHECHDVPSHRTHDVDGCEARMLAGSLQWLADAGFDVVTGTAKAPGATAFYVALEHLDFDEPEEFKGGSIGGVMAAAQEWAERKGMTP